MGREGASITVYSKACSQLYLEDVIFLKGTRAVNGEARGQGNDYGGGKRGL